jgi:hypothetical protein
MSAAATPPPLDWQAQVAQINRNIAETQKLFDESDKLRAEARKFRRDPWFILAGAIIGALATQLPAVLRAAGLIQ